MDITRYHYALIELPLCLENHPSYLAITACPNVKISPHENQPPGVSLKAEIRFACHHCWSWSLYKNVFQQNDEEDEQNHNEQKFSDFGMIDVYLNPMVLHTLLLPSDNKNSTSFQHRIPFPDAGCLFHLLLNHVALAARVCRLFRYIGAY